MHKWISLVLICFVSIVGCKKPSQPTAARSDSAADNDPFFGIGTTEESTEFDEPPTFDELVQLIKSTIGDIEPPPPPPPFAPPLSPADTDSILKQCLEILLTDPACKNSREFYGTAGDSAAILTNGSNSRWPDDFEPIVDGYDVELCDAATLVTTGNRSLGIRLVKLDLTAPSKGFMDGNIVLATYNAGGSANGAVIGSCLHYFKVHRDGGEVIVKYGGWFDS